jgi:hypothetical protein
LVAASVAVVLTTAGIAGWLWWRGQSLEPDGEGDGTFAAFAGQWKDRWHSFTIEPSGRGVGSYDFGLVGWGEFRIRAEGGKFFADMPHPGDPHKATRSFELHLQDDNTLELLGYDGKAMYILSKQAKPAPTALADLAGTWKADAVYEEGTQKGGPTLVLRLRELQMSIDPDGKGNATLSGTTFPFKIQESRKRFYIKEPFSKIDELENQQWILRLLPLFEGGQALRLGTANNAVRVYLFRQRASSERESTEEKEGNDLPEKAQR